MFNNLSLLCNYTYFNWLVGFNHPLGLSLQRFSLTACTHSCSQGRGMCSRAAHGGGSLSIQKERLTVSSQPRTDTHTQCSEPAIPRLQSAQPALHPRGEAASPAHIHCQLLGTARGGRTHQGLRNHREEDSWQRHRRVDMGATLSPLHKKLLPLPQLFQLFSQKFANFS